MLKSADLVAQVLNLTWTAFILGSEKHCEILHDKLKIYIISLSMYYLVLQVKF